jgi:hypothetical protein
VRRYKIKHKPQVQSREQVTPSKETFKLFNLGIRLETSKKLGFGSVHPIFVLWFSTIFLLVACDSVLSNHERSIEELSQAGYYVYILSDDYQNRFGWDRVVSMWSFDKQCSGFFSEDTWNPISAIYRNDPGDFFEVRISPQDAIWDVSKPANTISLDVQWIPSGEGTYYITDSGQVSLMIEDNFGMDVVVSSNLQLNYIIDLINQLAYIGPNPATVNNPWQAVCDD